MILPTSVLGTLGWLWVLPFFVAGAFLWSVGEYVLHRFAMHELKGRGVLSREHLMHHVRTHWHTGSAKLKGQDGDDVTFGGHSRHRLRDALRVWLLDHPNAAEQIARQRPDGPLAISHRTGRRRGSPGVPRRFDAVWVSPDFQVLSVSYDHDRAEAAGTDHALVVADLTLPG